MRSWSARSLASMKGIHPDLRAVLDRALHDSPHDFVVTDLPGRRCGNHTGRISYFAVFRPPHRKVVLVGFGLVGVDAAGNHGLFG